MTSEIGSVLAADDLVGVLTREVRVRLVNISASGCLVESSHRLELGTTGALALTIDGERFEDDVRVSRVQQMQGASANWHLGAEFLWTTQPGMRSLRRIVSRLRALLSHEAIGVQFAARRPM